MGIEKRRGNIGTRKQEKQTSRGVRVESEMHERIISNCECVGSRILISALSFAPDITDL